MNITTYKLAIGATALGLLLAVADFGQTPKQADVRELPPAQAIEREMKGAETHRYKFKLKKDEFFQARVEQKGVDVALRLVDAGGAELARMDSPNSKDGPETLSFAATATGEYRLEVAGFDAKAAKGNYSITRTVSRNATAADKRRVEIEKLFVEGISARSVKGQGETAIVELEAAITGWRELKDDYLIELTAKQIRQVAEVNLHNEPVFAEAFSYFQKGMAASFEVSRKKMKEAAAYFMKNGKTYYAALSLAFAALSENRLGNNDLALETYLAALPLFRMYKDDNWQGIALREIGGVYSLTGQKVKALEFLNDSLQFLKRTDDKQSEGMTLGNIGRLYSSLGDKQKALEIYNQALRIFKQLGDKQNEAVTLTSIGLVYSDLGEQQKALDYYNQSLPNIKQFGDKRIEAATLASIGAVYDNLGDKQQALKFYNQALPLQREVGEKAGEAVTLGNIGKVYLNLGDKQEALKFYNQALLLHREVGNKNGEAMTLTGTGAVYSELGDKQQALKFFNQALPLSREAGDKAGEAVTLINIGVVYDDLGEKQKALEYFQHSLPLSKTVGDKAGQAITLDWLMFYWSSLKNPRFAVFYGKQAVNLYQELRSNIALLDKGIQKTYLKSIESTYRRLADILITSGRIAEAEEVLAMLKEEEFFAYLRRDDKAAADLKGKISLSPDEKKAFADYEVFADEITRTAAELGVLEKKKNALPLGASLAAADQTQYDALKVKYDAAVVVFDKFLNDLKIRFGANDTRVAVVESDTQGILKRLGEPRTVIISTIVGEDRLNLIVTTSDTQRAHTVEIKAADLNKLVAEFRDAVKNPSVDPRPLGRKLYETLFPADLQKDLDNIKADTIVWSLDGTLRYAPMAALWDGKQYLVERYTNAVLTLASRDKINAATTDRAKWLALGVGVSKATSVKNADGSTANFAALAAVPQELCGVVRDPKKMEFCQSLGTKQTGVIGGLMLSDDEFTLQNFENNLGKVPVVHIASHFSLNAGDETDSYLLLGGGAERRFSLVSLKKTRLDKVELLTLSACNTAMTAGANSSGVEVEGFGALAQNQGVRTVLATLWSVADDSTRDLMTEFYRQLETNPNVGKAEALRAAQLKLINGKRAAADTANNRGTKIVNLSGAAQPEFRKDADAPFAHPFFWSPFILFGNWR